MNLKFAYEKRKYKKKEKYIYVRENDCELTCLPQSVES